MIIGLTLAAIVSATISGLVGMAGGVTLLAAMSLVMPIETLVPVHGVVQLISNFSRTVILFKNIHRRITVFFCVGIPFGGVLGYRLLSTVERPTWVLALIAFMLLYVVFKPKRLPEIVLPMWGFTVLGVTAGVIGCLVGATGPLLAPFYVRSDLEKEAIVATKSACQIAIHLVKIPVFIGLSFDYQKHWLLILCMAVGVVAGTKLGTSLLRKVSHERFMLILKFVMFVIALRLLYKLF